MQFKSNDYFVQNEKLLHELDKAIDDMEMDRELSIEDAFKEVSRLRNNNHFVRV